MSISFIKNQPFVFDYDNQFCGTIQKEYCLLMEPDDRIAYQVKFNSVETNILLDSTFSAGFTNWTQAGGGGWSISGGQATFDGLSGGQTSLYQDVLVYPDTLYEVRITVSGMTEGSLTIIIGNGGEQFEITNNGVYQFFGTNLTVGAFYRFQIFPSVNFDGAVDNCFCYKTGTSIGIGVFDLEDNLITTIDESFVNIVGRYASVNVTPADLELEDGCYRLKMIDNNSFTGEELIINGNFADGYAYWVTTGPTGMSLWDLQPYYASVVDMPTSPSVDIILYADNGTNVNLQNLIVGETYQLTYLLSTLDNCENITSYNGTPFATDTTTGTKTVTFVANNAIADINFQMIPLVNEDNEYVIENISLRLTTSNYIYESNCFNVKQSQECTKLFEWTNNRNAFGFAYGTCPITFSLRLVSEFLMPKYKQDVIDFDDTTYRTINEFATNREEIEVFVDMVPRNIHRCIAIARLHNDFTIDGVTTYAVKEDYEPIRNAKDKLNAQSRFLIYQTTEQMNGCGTDYTQDPEFLIDPTTGDCVISLE